MFSSDSSKASAGGPALLLAVLLALVAAAAAQERQEPPRTEPPAERPVIRAAARLVEISVVAQDRNGRPVTDLTAADFIVREDGKEQEIAVFQMETLRAAPPAEPLPAGVVTNRLERKGAPAGVVTVILLDGLNTEVADQNYARKQVLQLLEQLRPEDRVALYAFSRTIRVLHDFTSDASALVAAVERYRSRAGGELDASRVDDDLLGFFTPDAGLGEWIRNAQERRAQSYAADRARVTAGVMESIANHLARIPGRKNLVWVSSGFPFNLGEYLDRSQAALIRPQANLEPVVERAARALNDANVAVYPVDARGLIAPFDPALQGGRPLPSRRQLIGPGTGGSPAFDLSPTQDSMERLAQLTGGRTFFGTNDLSRAIREAIDESSVTYTLAYYPTHGRWDGKFRNLRVEVTRPGVRVRHRRGYYALPDRAPLDEPALQTLMLEAAASPLDATAIGVTAQLSPVSGAPGQRLDMTIETGDLVLPVVGGGRTGALDVWFVLLNETGEPFSAAKYQIPVSLDDADYARALADGLRHSRYMEFPPEARGLRVVVRDAATGAMGSLRLPVSR
jgi:VWFA-related protein